MVGMGTPEESAAFAEKFESPFQLISDPNMSFYKAFGLRSASTMELLSPSLAIKAIASMAQGYSVGKPVGDIGQLPGVFIIDTKGDIVFSHIAEDAADHPKVETITTALNKIRSA